MKKVLVVDVAAEHSGGAEILKEFFNYVCRERNGCQWLFLVSVVPLIVPDDAKDEVEVIRYPDIKKSLLSRMRWEMKDICSFTNGFVPDVVLSLQNLTIHVKGIPQVVYMHQSLPFQSQKNFSFLKQNERAAAFQQKIMGKLIKTSIRKADGVIVQTQWVADAIMRQVSIEKKNVLIAPPSVKPVTLRKSEFHLQHLYQIDTPVLFYPSLGLSYKNHLRLLEAVSKLNEDGFPVRLILTVSQKDGFYDVIKNYIDSHDLDCVIVGYIPKEDLYELLCNTRLIYPSYIETVGLPLVEAQSFSTCIAVSDCPYAHNVCDQYPKTVYFNYKSVDSICQAIKQLCAMKIALDEDEYRMQIPEQFKAEVTWKEVVDFVIRR